MKAPVTQVPTMLVKTKNYYMLLQISHIFQLLFEYQPLTKPVATCLMTELMCEDNIKTLRGDPLSSALTLLKSMLLVLQAGAIIRSQIWNLVPNGTKVPKWSQKSPNFTSKSQISDFTFR